MASCAPKTDFCSRRMARETKYICIKCGIPVCNICSHAEDNEETRGWLAGRNVGYCSDCVIEVDTTQKTPSRTDAASIYSETDDESLASGDDANLNIIKGKGRTPRKRPGRKAQWPESLLNDLVDIITNDDYFKNKLIFTNVKNSKNADIYEEVRIVLKKRAYERNEDCPYTAVQLRTKFKKSVAECKKAAMLMKSGSGIKRFQDDRGYGMWFTQLFALVKTRASCQSEQAIEPFAIGKSGEEQLLPSPNSLAATSSDSQELFVPVPVQGKRRQTKKGHFLYLMERMKKVVEKDPMSDFLAFAREEAEKSRQHELQLMQLLVNSQMIGAQQQPGCQNPQQQANYGNIQGQQDMDNYSSYYMF